MGYVPQVETVDWNFPVTVLEVVVMTRSSTGRLPRVTKDERADALLVLERLGLGRNSPHHGHHTPSPNVVAAVTSKSGRT